MPIWFVCRSPYEGSTGKYVRRLDGADTILDWFRTNWYWESGPGPHSSRRFADELLGTHVYGFETIFENADEENLPSTPQELHDVLQEHLYVEGSIAFEPGALRVQTDDDDVELAYFFFDDTFAAAHPERVAYLLNNDERLPASSDPEDGQPGSTYLIFDTFWGSSHLSELAGPVIVRGTRLPGLFRYVIGGERLVERSECEALFNACTRVLEAGDGLERSFRQSLRDDAEDEATWSAYSDWSAEQGLPAPGLRLLHEALVALNAAPKDLGLEYMLETRPAELVLLDVGDHHLTFSMPYARWGTRDLFHRWIFFDDLWASAHPHLSAALIDYVTHWDSLRDPESPPR
jgi:hypothetical protein